MQAYVIAYAQYTPPTRRVESRRRRVGVGGVYWIRN